MEAEAGPSAEIAIDAHVHVYEIDRAGELLRSAARNLARASGVSARTAALMLTESARFDAFSRLRDAGKAGNVAIEQAAEEEVLCATVEGWELLILAGRQIVSAEGLEVHALCTTVTAQDGLPLARLLDTLQERDVLVVLPWAVGKWLGSRRRAVKAALARWGGRLFLSDNAGRPRFWNEPLFREAGKVGAKILAGSDPLPLPGAESRVGAVGCAIRAGLSRSTAASDLRKALRDPQRPVRRFGALEAPMQFVADQIRLRTGDGVIRV